MCKGGDYLGEFGKTAWFCGPSSFQDVKVFKMGPIECLNLVQTRVFSPRILKPSGKTAALRVILYEGVYSSKVFLG